MLDWFRFAGDQHDVEAFIKSGIDLNTKDAMGQTAFHLAVKKGYEDIVKMLMKNAAFQNIEDDNGDSPLSLAIETGEIRRKNPIFFLLCTKWLNINCHRPWEYSDAHIEWSKIQ